MNVLQATRRALFESGNRLDSKERRRLQNAIHADPILGGNQKVDKVSRAITPLTNALAKAGFNLDMVTGDILLGDKGSRQLRYSRKPVDGSDLFTEGEPITNSLISFTWETLEPGRVEVIAYAS